MSVTRLSDRAAFLVAVDIRKGSPTLGQWFGTEVNAENKKQIWAPAGFARGFCGLTEGVEIQYLTTGVYNNSAESNIAFNDPAIGIEWPVANPIISERDTDAQTLEEWLKTPDSDNFKY